MDVDFLFTFPNIVYVWLFIFIQFPIFDYIVDKGMRGICLMELVCQPVYKVLTIKDHVILVTNATLTVPFIYHYLKIATTLPSDPSEATVLNTAGYLFLSLFIYDFFYYFFHRALHIPAFYSYVHKHHHALLTPSRGNTDAINTHPFEYLVGMYLHLVPIYFLPIHRWGAMAFMPVAAVFTTLNHTRWSLHLPFIWNSLDHDVHHRVNTCNYGQYVMLWDYVFNSFQGYYERPDAIPDYGPVQAWSQQSPRKVVVIGSEGLVGQRLVEMLIERGAQEVVAMDIKSGSVHTDAKVRYVCHNMANPDNHHLLPLLENADVVYLTAALVGPYHPKHLYYTVNVEGTQLMADLSRKAGVKKFVFVGSPSTRFGPLELYGQHEASLPYPKVFADEYARTKAIAEQWVRKQDCPEFHTCVISPHQVYGAKDRLFMWNILRTAANGQLRVLGSGTNLVSFTHVDNIVHAIILAGNALVEGSPVCGNWYVITDGGKYNFWDIMDSAVTACGLPSIKEKTYVPLAILYPLAYVCKAITMVTGYQLSLNPFSVRMITIHRWFKIDKAETHLGYKPVNRFEDAFIPAVKEVYEAYKNDQKVQL